MRVVSGSARGTTLLVPKSDLRPTMEVVKNAIFNTLAESVEGTRVLDLFGGSGSLGIEALSRGAESCLFVESDRKACTCIRKNLEKTRLNGEVVCADILQWLPRLALVAEFHLIFADPPYAKYPGEHDFTPDLLGSAQLRRALTSGGLFILEHLPGATLPLGEHWECVRQRKYGATEVAFLRPKPTSEG